SRNSFGYGLGTATSFQAASQQARSGVTFPCSSPYRRLLDAATHSFHYVYQFGHLQREAWRAAHKLLLGQIPQSWQISSELISALHGVRLCGSVQVIAAAETLVAATSDMDLNEKSADRSQQQAQAVVTAQGVFLDACREDLAYTVRWWQLKRRFREWRFTRAGQAGH
ncbi:hypothetical protein ABZ371_32270, partial [Streptomyces sp. NPDC005899]